MTPSAPTARFLEAVLGGPGAAAVLEVVGPDIAVPRAAAAWLLAGGACSRYLPGTRVPAELRARSGSWSGRAGRWDLDLVPLSRAVAAVALALGVQPGPPPRPADMARLGRTVDLLALARVQVVLAAARAPAPPVPPGGLTRDGPACGEPQTAGGAFEGCRCLRDLAGDVRHVRAPDGGAELLLGNSWDEGAVTFLLEVTGARRHPSSPH